MRLQNANETGSAVKNKRDAFLTYSAQGQDVLLILFAVKRTRNAFPTYSARRKIVLLIQFAVKRIENAFQIQPYTARMWIAVPISDVMRRVKDA